VSEWILNGTSAQLGYTVPFTLVHTEKYRIEDKLNIQTINNLNTTQKKSKQCKNSRLLRYSARKRGGLILQWSPKTMQTTDL